MNGISKIGKILSLRVKNLLTVVGGGVGTILMVLLVALLAPQLRRLTTLCDPKLEDKAG